MSLCVLLSAQNINIIPRPKLVEMRKGNFVINEKTAVSYNDPQLKFLAEYTSATIKSLNKIQLPVKSTKGIQPNTQSINLILDEVKRLIDEMVTYKFNILQLHLSDDQGWRIEIKKLPDLTKVGAWRVPRTGLWWDREPPQEGEAATYGGFYTQEQIKELVAYAAKRHVNILPEIDVPGHSLAAIASYPYLSSSKSTYKVNPGSQFYKIEDNTLCISKESTFEFLNIVFSEIAELFPFKYSLRF